MLCFAGMGRDYRKLEVFGEANRLVPEIYALTATMPVHERYGLVVQIRKAAVSVPTNLVEGSSRRSTSDYCRFIEIAYGSAREVEYLLSLSVDLKFLDPATAQLLVRRYNRLQARLVRLLESLEAAEANAAAEKKKKSG